MRRQITGFASEFLRAAGWQAYASGTLMIALGMLDGIGLLLLVPLLGAAGLASASPAALPSFLQYGFTAYIPGEARLEAIVLVYLTVVLAYVSLKLAAVWLNSTLIERYSADTRTRTHAQLTQMSWREILLHRGANVAHALTTNVDTVTRGALALLQFTTSAVLFLVQFAVALYLSPALALGAAAVLIVATFASRRLYRQVFSDARGIVATGTRLHHGAEDFVRRHRHVRAFDNEEQSQREFRAEVQTYSRGMREIQWAMGKTQFLTEASAVILIALTFYIGFRVLEVPLTSLVVFTVVLARILPRAMALQREAQVIAAALPARQALGALTRPKGSIEQRQGAVAERFTDPVSIVTWENISYRIDALRWQIDRLELQQGKLLALVGPSGVGKSVLCDVLTGLLEPDSGQCTINGAALPPGVSLATVLRVGYLAQHSRPWQATVGAAMRWAAAGAADQECWAALEQAGLAASLKARSGLDTPLGDSALWLSGGELHRLALAQVLMRKPQILILDEPSAALDAGTELRLVETIKSLATNHPVLVITHRESVARAADRVLVMKERPDGTRFIEHQKR